MKVTLSDHGTCFEVFLEAETMEEAAAITRFQVNHTKELRGVYAYTTKSGSFQSSVVIGKVKNPSESIPRGK